MREPGADTASLSSLVSVSRGKVRQRQRLKVEKRIYRKKDLKRGRRRIKQEKDFLFQPMIQQRRERERWCRRDSLLLSSIDRISILFSSSLSTREGRRREGKDFKSLVCLSLLHQRRQEENTKRHWRKGIRGWKGERERKRYSFLITRKKQQKRGGSKSLKRKVKRESSSNEKEPRSLVDRENLRETATEGRKGVSLLFLVLFSSKRK